MDGGETALRIPQKTTNNNGIFENAFSCLFVLQIACIKLHLIV